MERLGAHATVALSTCNKKRWSRKAVQASPHSHRKRRVRKIGQKRHTLSSLGSWKLRSLRSMNKHHGAEFWKTSIWSPRCTDVMLIVFIVNFAGHYESNMSRDRWLSALAGPSSMLLFPRLTTADWPSPHHIPPRFRRRSWPNSLLSERWAHFLFH